MKRELKRLFRAVLIAFVLIVGSASAQTFIAGGAQIGGNTVETRDKSKVGGMVAQPGTRIDKYTFVGGFVEGQYDYRLSQHLSIAGRGLAELTTDPKNLGTERDGYRYHLRPEVELAIGAYGKFAITAHGGGGYTHIRNSQYNKSGLNPHAGIGLDFNRQYRVSVARIFKDTSNYNDNETHGYRGRFDALVPFSPKWGAKLGIEYTRYYNQIPGVKDYYSPYPCGCLRTQSDSLAFRVGIARIFGK